MTQKKATKRRGGPGQCGDPEEEKGNGERKKKKNLEEKPLKKRHSYEGRNKKKKNNCDKHAVKVGAKRGGEGPSLSPGEGRNKIEIRPPDEKICRNLRRKRSLAGTKKKFYQKKP